MDFKTIKSSLWIQKHGYVILQYTSPKTYQKSGLKIAIKPSWQKQ
jgi:hypothetical protein